MNYPVARDAAVQPAIDAALAAVDAFTERFNARDPAGMDALLHFPHVIILAERMIVWNAPGALPPDFFNDGSEFRIRASGAQRRAHVVSVRRE